LIVLSGCEAKVLPDGSLDALDNIIKEVDYPLFAFHNFPKDLNLILDCLKGAITNNHINAWAHPNMPYDEKDVHVDSSVLLDIFRIIRQNNMLLERNCKYNLGMGLIGRRNCSCDGKRKRFTFN